MNIKWISFFSIILVLMSCDAKNAQKTTPSTQENSIIIPDDNVKITYDNAEQKQEDAEHLRMIRGQAHSLIKSRAEKDNNEAFSMIVVDYWTKKFEFDGDKISGEGDYDGHWMKFNEDFTYDYGVYDEITGGGKYHFNLDDLTMLMVDSNTSKSPRVWNILSKENVIILVGSNDPLFGNDARQIKFEKESNRPTKS